MKQKKEPYIPLTIDGQATKALLKRNFLYLNRFAARAKIAEATLSEVLNGNYDSKSEHPKSNYQRVLQKIQRAGCLVQLNAQPLDIAA